MGLATVCMITAKDFVPTGAPLHERASVDAAPSQVYSAGKRPPSVTSGLVRANPMEAEADVEVESTGETEAAWEVIEAGAHPVKSKMNTVSKGKEVCRILVPFPRKITKRCSEII